MVEGLGDEGARRVSELEGEEGVVRVVIREKGQEAVSLVSLVELV